MLRRVLIVLAAILVLGGLGLFGASRYCPSASADPAFFEDAIRAFEAADRTYPPAPGAIVFVGSSSIRMWDGLVGDMAPLRVLERGFGGAHLAHVVHNARRIVLPYAPQAVVVYAGDNDLAAGSGKSVADVVADADGPPPDSLFLLDGLHLSDAGYALWTDVIRAQLLADFGPPPGR